MNLDDSLIDEEQNGAKEDNNDRELIDEYMLKVRETQRTLVAMNQNNGMMKTVTEQAINENDQDS